MTLREDCPRLFSRAWNNPSLLSEMIIWREFPSRNRQPRNFLRVRNQTCKRNSMSGAIRPTIIKNWIENWTHRNHCSNANKVCWNSKESITMTPNRKRNSSCRSSMRMWRWNSNWRNYSTNLATLEKRLCLPSLISGNNCRTWNRNSTICWWTSL